MSKFYSIISSIYSTSKSTFSVIHPSSSISIMNSLIIKTALAAALLTSIQSYATPHDISCYAKVYSDSVVDYSKGFTFAVLADTHQGSFDYAEKDLINSINDINNNPDIKLVVIAGDITEFGTDNEIFRTREILKLLTKPFLFVPGNHDTNWSENGCTICENRFQYVTKINSNIADSLQFIGISSGPYMRMGPCQSPKEDVEWLKEKLQNSSADMPTIFVIHSPLITENLANSRDILDLLEQKDVILIISGHFHVNKEINYGNIHGVICRSNLRRKDKCGGYTIINIDPDFMMTAAEKRPCEQSVRAPWSKRDLSARAYPIWSYQDHSDIASGTAYNNNRLFFTNTIGEIVAQTVQPQRREIWRYKTGNKIFATPILENINNNNYVAELLWVASTDGNIYCINTDNGSLRWRFETGYPLIATPIYEESAKNSIGHNTATDGRLYIPGGKGKFFCINASTGEKIWETEGIKGYMETKPLIFNNYIIMGCWGAELFAIDKRDGKFAWRYEIPGGRYNSPGACQPVIIEASKSCKIPRLYVNAANRTLYCFNAESGEVIWESKEPKGRESIGITNDKKILFVKGIKDTLVAIDPYAVNEDNVPVYRELWRCNLNYGEEYAPTSVVCNSKYAFVPTGNGKVYCVDILSGQMIWVKEFSKSLITSILPIEKDKIAVTTMDGKLSIVKFLQ